ncbi:TPA: hypothetical protein PTW95_000384 [Clostridium botulinum]|uniref:exosporium protein CsxC n=1 Tax=Clostridium botulinum TaxID=1491 RepID=UPI00046693B0|nr:exosporium protein CsxC [Clostridium botulinum]APQ74525.1 hypothetical protein RSJ9_1680 [Clostridium botulinum]AUM87347.1 hypothetical protein RSJ15_06430 [Clostridium botulinum]AUN21197.1 hypothetical protein RSJ22_07005 [Clostridium botulinum]AWB29920.1 hypothetical protein DBN47_06485 [Clostridium botulinum]KEJ02319.1 hypothetical protein N497_06205 [Clostridium botulinum F 357]
MMSMEEMRDCHDRNMSFDKGHGNDCHEHHHNECHEHHHNECHEHSHKDCGKVLESKTVPMCEGTNLTPQTVRRPVVAKIPVVLAEKEIQIDVESKTRLKEKFLEIKRIKKDVFLTQCELIPRAGVIENGVPRTAKLFISGFIRKNIEFATADCIKDDVVSGEIKHTTEKIPFTCVTEVRYITPPVLANRERQREMELFCSERQCEQECNCEEEKLGRLTCQEFLEDSITLVEKPFCELLGARIFEADIQRKPCFEKGVKVFDELVEKMVVFIRVKVLQLQQVTVGDPNNGSEDGCRK